MYKIKNHPTLNKCNEKIEFFVKNEKISAPYSMVKGYVKSRKREIHNSISYFSVFINFGSKKKSS